MSPKESFLRRLLKVLIFIENVIFVMLLFWTTAPFLRMWRKDIHNVLAFKVEAALTECVLNILVFMQAYLRTSQINLNNLHVFTGEWSSVLLNNN